MRFSRSCESQLNEWLTSNLRKPLILRGARQVGKSTLVRHFCEKQNLDLFEIDLEKHQRLSQVFSACEVEPVLKELSVINKRDISASHAPLIFLDEIQGCTPALKWLRYVHEEKPELPVIAAGSLLEFALRDKNYSVPVGRIEYMWLYPMSFLEYLEATSDSFLGSEIKSYGPGKIWPIGAHLQLLKRFREYLFVGGMPAALHAFLTQGPNKAVETQSALLTSMIDDLAKYTQKHPLTRLQAIFRSIPTLIGGQIKYTNLSRADSHRDIKDVIDLFCMAGIIRSVYHSDGQGLPLGAGVNTSKFKFLFLDVGLVSRSLGLRWEDILDATEERLVNEGSLAESFVGQELIAAQSCRTESELFYWTREKPQSNAEVDYLASSQGRVVPVEVKSGSTGRMRSLHQFMGTHPSQLAMRLDLGMPSQTQIHAQIPSEGGHVAIHYSLQSLPLYMASQILGGKFLPAIGK